MYFASWMDTGKVNPNAPNQRWYLNDDGGISWNVSEEKNLPHYDHIEMAGFGAASLISYGVNEDKTLRLFRRLIVPQLRMVPDKTRASFSHNFEEETSPIIKVDGDLINEYFVEEVSICANLSFECTTNSNLEIKRTLYPAFSQRATIEEWILKNPTDKKLSIEIKDSEYSFKEKGKFGIYQAETRTYYENKQILESITVDLPPSETRTLHFIMLADNEKKIESISINPKNQIKDRIKFKNDLWDKLILETPDPIINRQFQFSKLRSCESIFDTINGLMHSPGGGSYYAASWTNDQCEYSSPFFAFTGYDKAIEQSINVFNLFSNFMKENYYPMPSSLISEGRSFWGKPFGKDRGDAAMYAYGAARFVLANGDEDVANAIWPHIQWALEYCKRQLNKDGVVRSESDELEGRFPTGSANLCTSSLYYDALRSASFLAKDLKEYTQAEKYAKEAENLYIAIERYFGENMKGYETYRYYKGNKKLRSWIAIPLAMGIYERAEGSIDALYSDNLWFGNGMLTEEGDKTFWDRTTLYAFRGALAAGETKRTMKYLTDYTQKRTLGEHVPYPVEAWPEGNQKHLSAEGALYCRIFTEGMLGIRPTGLKSFTLTPQLPENWDYINLQKIHAFDTIFDINIKKIKGNRLSVTLYSESGEILFYEDKELFATYKIKF